MQYVGQRCRFLKTRFTEHDRRMHKTRKLIIFFRHFKHMNHFTYHISILPVGKILYNDNSTKIYRNTLLSHDATVLLVIKWTTSYHK